METKLTSNHQNELLNQKPNKPIPFTETDDERQARLKRPIGATDYLLVKQACPDIPDEFLLQLMFGGR